MVEYLIMLRDFFPFGYYCTCFSILVLGIDCIVFFVAKAFCCFMIFVEEYKK